MTEAARGGVSKAGRPPYADVWADGTVVVAGERECEMRFAAIRDYLDADAPTVLDVGANTGYFGIRLAEEAGGHATLADDYAGLPKSAPGWTSIPRRLTVDELRHLPRHDVVLSLSVLHHFEDWRGALEALRACRRTLFCEVPHPGERWMRRAASRHELGEIHDAVASLGELIHESPRRGRDGSEWLRPMYAIPGSVETFTGTVFSGSGTCSRRLPQQADLPDALSYRPFPGSLNLHTDFTPGPPRIDYVGPKGRDYQFWPAWVGEICSHVMVPGDRGWPGSVELVAPVRLREALDLRDGDPLRVDVLR